MTQQVVIIGGGQAAAQCIASLRQYEFRGDITLVCEEGDLPYQRPPLSKAYMKGDITKDRLFFKPAEWYREQNIECLLNVTGEEIDRAAKTVRLSNGEDRRFDKLVLATGTRPRELKVDGADSSNIHYLRTLGDVEALRPKMQKQRTLCVIGAGYIGLEAAAIASQLDMSVTVLEMAGRVLERVTSPLISGFYNNLHREHGVDVQVGTQMQALITENGLATHALLSDGTKLEADIFLVGIGVLSNQELAQSASLDCDNGILVNDDTQTSDPNIFAIGDCSRRPLEIYKRIDRLESVHNAIEQGKLAAAAIAEQPRPRLDCPWFWSDQYDVKLQIAGLSAGYDSTVLRGCVEDRRFSVFYFSGDRLIAVDAVNSPPEFMISKKVLLTGGKVSKMLIADTNVSLKDAVNIG